jgi:phosphoadenosine phosphosulfate reductase
MATEVLSDAESPRFGVPRGEAPGGGSGGEATWAGCGAQRPQAKSPRCQQNNRGAPRTARNVGCGALRPQAKSLPRQRNKYILTNWIKYIRISRIQRLASKCIAARTGRLARLGRALFVGATMTALPAQTEVWDTDAISALNARFRGQPPEQLLEWAAEQFGRSAALTCSFGGAAGMVLLDMAARRSLPIEIVFLDTDLLFPATYALASEAEQRYGISIRRARPTLSLDEQGLLHGPELFARDPDRCCAIRKVVPLAEALRPYAAWVSGIRRDQTANRASTEPVQWSAKHNLLKLSPLAYWGEREVWAYISAHQVPYNPLLDQGYPSIGCAPCTRPAGAADGRGGRWSGFSKTECGLHT